MDPGPPPETLATRLLLRWRDTWVANGGREDESLFAAITVVAQRISDFIASGLAGEDSAAEREALADAAVGLAPLVDDVGAIHDAIGLAAVVVSESVSAEASSLRVVVSAVCSACAAGTKRYLADIERTADFDPLTGLRRRDTFERELRAAIEQTRETGEPFTLAIIDLDDLKKLNDQGYSVGDNALAELARLLTETTKAGDTAYRWGGDEFPIIFKRSSRDDVELALGRVEVAGAPPFSRGSATFPDEADDANSLWLVAEARLKVDKQNRKAGRDAP